MKGAAGGWRSSSSSSGPGTSGSMQPTIGFPGPAQEDGQPRHRWPASASADRLLNGSTPDPGTPGAHAGPDNPGAYAGPRPQRGRIVNRNWDAIVVGARMAWRRVVTNWKHDESGGCPPAVRGKGATKCPSERRS